MFLLAKWAMAYFTRLAAATPPPPQEALLAEIRDLLKAKTPGNGPVSEA